MCPEAPPARPRFTVFARLMHWVMAPMVLAMLFIGVIMVASLANYHLLLAIHRPLGIAILVLVIVRFGYRLTHRPPKHPSTMHPVDHLAAMASEYLLYTLLFVQPLIGWATLSSAGVPVQLFGPVRLPPIAPRNTVVYSVLRESHVVLAYLLFLVFVAHLCGVLFHTLVLRDGILDRMAFWRTSATTGAAGGQATPAAKRTPTP
jgi:cytochrome b561